MVDEPVKAGCIYAPSSDVVAREVQGVTIILPIGAGVGDLEDELYTLNETGQAIWSKLDGRRTLRSVIRELSSEYHAEEAEVQTDVLGLVQELVNRRMLVRVLNG